METQEKLTFLRELFHCAYSIASWIYDEDGKLLNTDSEKPEISQLFERSGCLEDALNWEDPTPLCLGETLGMLWGGGGDAILLEIIQHQLFCLGFLHGHLVKPILVLVE